MYYLVDLRLFQEEDLTGAGGSDLLKRFVTGV